MTQRAAIAVARFRRHQMATRVARPPARPSSAPVAPLGVLPRRQVTGIFPALVVLAAAVVLTVMTDVAVAGAGVACACAQYASSGSVAADVGQKPVSGQ